LASDAKATAEEVMRNGPATFRPDEPLEKMAKRMRERGARTVLVTTSDGRLVIGVPGGRQTPSRRADVKLADRNLG
jgi:CBS domain-containing protein